MLRRIRAAMNDPYPGCVKELMAAGTIRHIGMSSHNPAMFISV